MPRASRPHMPGYGTLGPTEGSGLLSWAWAEERLVASRTFWLSTTWPDGRPHSMPIWAIWHADALWFSSSKGSRKARNLARDPRCSLSTDDAATPVVVDGVAELLVERADLETLLAIENAKYGTNYGMDMLDPAENSAFRVRPRWAFALRTDDFSGSPTRWIFET